MNELMTKENELLELSIEQQKQMANNMSIMYQEMKNMKLEMKQDLAEVREVQAGLRKQITLTRGEISRLRRLVMQRSKALTYSFFKEPVNEELFNAKRGHTISYLWIVLKNRYNVGTYTEISHMDFEDAMKTLKKLTVHDFPEAYYRLTPKMKELTETSVHYIDFLEENGWEI